MATLDERDAAAACARDHWRTMARRLPFFAADACLFFERMAGG